MTPKGFFEFEPDGKGWQILDVSRMARNSSSLKRTNENGMKLS